MQQLRIRTKICGLTQVEDLMAAAESGADAVGFVFYPPSSRSIPLQQAKELLRVIPPFMTSVALFVNPEVNWVKQVVDQLPIDVLQFHGDESGEFCRQFSRPYIKAIRFENADGLHERFQNVTKEYVDAQALLFDAFDPILFGGTGQVADWSMLASLEDGKIPFILAGGLNVGNVQQAIEQVRPFAVDVSSGVEGDVAGKKDRQLIREFIAKVNQCKLEN